MESVTSFGLKVMILVFVILAPIQAVMLTIGFLIFVDLVSGIWAALKRREKITSAALRRTISKMFIYQFAIISGFLIEQNILQGAFPITKIVAGFMGIVELKSILENGNSILGQNIFKILIQKLGSKNDQL